MIRKLRAAAASMLFAALVASCSSFTVPISATSNPLGTKVGTARTVFLFGVFPLKRDQDAGIAAAARNGGITRISTVDMKVHPWIIGVTRTTIVTGE